MVMCLCFFFQAEDGIRDSPVTGVQTCALPICWNLHLCTSDSTKTEVTKAAETADFILVFGHGVSDTVLRLAKKTKLVQLCSAGFDGINLKLAGELGIPVADRKSTRLNSSHW